MSFIRNIIIVLSLAIISGCVTPPVQTDQESPVIYKTLSIQLPIKIKEKSRITIIPVLTKENLKNPTVSPLAFNQYVTNLADQIKETLSNRPYEVSILTYPIVDGNLVLEMMHMAKTTDYYTVVSIYDIENTVSDTGITTVYESGETRLVKRFVIKSRIKTRIEFYDAAHHIQLWNAGVSIDESTSMQQNISGTKELDQLASALIMPNHFDKINNEIIGKSAQQLSGSIQDFSATINPNLYTDLAIYIYNRRVSINNLIRYERVKIVDLLTGQRREVVTDASGQVKIQLPEGFYDFESQTYDNSGRLAGSNKMQMLITGNHRRLNLVLK